MSKLPEVIPNRQILDKSQEINLKTLKSFLARLLVLTTLVAGKTASTL